MIYRLYANSGSQWNIAHRSFDFNQLYCNAASVLLQPFLKPDVHISFDRSLFQVSFGHFFSAALLCVLKCLFINVVIKFFSQRIPVSLIFFILASPLPAPGWCLLQSERFMDENKRDKLAKYHKKHYKHLFL